MVAIVHGHVDTVAALLADSRVDVNEPPFDSSSPSCLQVAARNGHAEIVRMLIATNRLNVCKWKDEEGVQSACSNELEWYNRESNRALAAAAAFGHAEVLDALLSSTLQLDVNSVEECCECCPSPPCHVWCRQQEHDGRSVLQLASENGHVECVRRLLQANEIDVGKIDKVLCFLRTRIACHNHIVCAEKQIRSSLSCAQWARGSGCSFA